MHWERIDEKIEVRVDFAGGVATPRLFRLGSRLHRVRRVNAHWTKRAGRRCIHLFAVTTESHDAYQLRFDGEQLGWHADAVICDG